MKKLLLLLSFLPYVYGVMRECGFLVALANKLNK